MLDRNQTASFYLRGIGLDPATGTNFRSDIEFGFLGQNGEHLLSHSYFDERIPTHGMDTTFGTYDGILAYGLFYNLDSFGPISPGAYVSFEFEGIVGVPMPELSVVPAPNTIALVMLGVIGVGVARKKKRHGLYNS